MIQSRIAQNDKRVLRKYLQREDLARFDVRFVFRNGDPVLLRSREIGKLKSRATGPFTFGHYVGTRKVNAVIYSMEGKAREVSALNLLPMHSSTAAKRVYRRFPRNESPNSSDTGSSISDPKNVLLPDQWNLPSM